MDLKDAIRNAVRPEKTVKVCLRGDLVAEHETRTAELEAAQGGRVEDQTLAPDDATRQLADRITALEADMDAASADLRLVSRSPAEWKRIRDAHPPRPGVENDQTAGYNFDEGLADLLRASIVPPLDDTEWDALNAALSNGQYSSLAMTAHYLTNASGVDIPKSSTASAAVRRRAATQN